jgi:hypothetical protein
LFDGQARPTVKEFAVAATNEAKEVKQQMIIATGHTPRPERTVDVLAWTAVETSQAMLPSRADDAADPRN